MSAIQQMLAAFSSQALALTFTNVVYSNVAAIALPTGTTVGDLLLYCDGPSSNTGVMPTLVSPAGWTQASTITAINGFAAHRATVFYKTATAGDISSGSITGSTGNVASRKIMTGFRPSRTINTVIRLGALQQGIVGSPLPQTIVCSNSAAPCLAFAYLRTTATTTITGTGITTLEDPNSIGNVAAYEIQDTSTINRTVSVSSASNRTTLQSFYLALT